VKTRVADNEYRYYHYSSKLSKMISKFMGFKCFVVEMDIGQTENDILQAKLIIGGSDAPDSYLAAVMDDPDQDAWHAYEGVVKKYFDVAAINPKQPKHIEKAGNSFYDFFEMPK
jgi:hypothetical protein